jgi:hypothetical protein
MKRAPRSRQRHDLYAKYHDYDSEISDLLGECGLGVVRRFQLLAILLIELRPTKLHRLAYDAPDRPPVHEPFRNGNADVPTCGKAGEVFRGLRFVAQRQQRAGPLRREFP